MTTVNCSGNEELDFRLIFAEDAQQHSLGPTGVDPDDSTLYYTQSLVNQPIREDTQSHHPTLAPLQTHSSYDPSYEVHSSRYSPMGHPKAFDCPSIQITSIAPNPHQDVGTSQDAVPVRGAEGECSERSWSRDHLYLPLDPCYRDSTLSPSPCSSLSSRSWLSDVSSCESFSHVYDDVEAELNEAAARFTLGGSPLASPLASPGCSPQAVGNIGFGVELWQQQYQHPLCFTQSLSPHQSPRQSPCHSPHHSPRTSVTDENWLNPRPTSRSSSRPTSPCGKRRHSSADVYARSPSPHHSPSPTPGHSPRGSVTEDTWGGISAAAMGPLQYSYPEVDVPSKTRRTSAAHMALLTGLGDAGLEDQCAGLPYLDLPVEESVSALKQDDGLAELFLSVPSHFTWNKPKPGNAPLFRTSSLPPLDWPLPSQFGQCELKMEVQPRSHHRAHYETEGSRGAVKATSGGHPVVKLIGYNEKPVNLQVFIGTADDRYLRPHAFYQVHRVTGKTVSTTCQENIISCTKVLEIPLLPENNMSTSIDCAGILKLRNSDIELRKGETDIGRKNTRVRIAFRVHIPQPNGKVLCLQAASIPVECSQRSAQELPHVERFSLVNCSVAGGEEMVITGSNISPESKVIFQEKGPDGRTLWEVDAKVMRDKSNGSSIVVVIPPYYNKTVGSAVQVQFYVCHGKRRRSLTQNFTYLADTTDCRTPATDCAAVSPLVKQEHRDSVYPPGLYPASTQLPSPDHVFPQDRSLYGSSGHPVPCAQPSQTAYSPLGSSPLQHSPHLHGCSPSMGYKHQRISSMHTVDPTPATRRRSPYQATQPGMPYSGQPSASMRSAPPQVSQTMSAQAKTSGSSSHREGMMFLSHIRHGSDLQAPGSDLQSTTSQARDRTSTQLHSLSYHGSHSGSAQGAPLQTEHSLSYHSARDASASYSPNHAADPSVPPTAISGVPPRHLPPSLGPSRASLISVDLRKHPPAPHSLFSNSEERVNIKQEPEEKLTLGSMGLQEITLDDVNEIIDRDISQLSGGAELIQSGQDNLGWDQNSSDTVQPFCGLH